MPDPAETPTVLVVGAGPAGLAAARRLRDHGGVRVRLLAPGGAAEYLPGSFAVATGDASPTEYREPVRLDGVEVIDAVAEEITGEGAFAGGRWHGGAAVVAAPGLAVDPFVPVDGAPAAGFWDPRAAADATPLVAGLRSGTITVAVASALYRCPPAPYGLAMRLARRARKEGRDVQVRLVTPEPKPVAAIGSSVSDYLAQACTEAGVEVVHEFRPDPDALRAGRVTDGTHEYPTDVALVVPPHRRHRLLEGLNGDGLMVAAGAHGETDVPGLFVAGDAVASPFPRAAAPATVSGIAAAEGALGHAGLADPAAPALPEPDCFVDRGAGEYGRITIDFPDGAPPAGAPRVVIDPRQPADEFDAAEAAWRAGCRG